MPWPNSDIVTLADVQAGAFSTGIQANFPADAERTGRLLLAHYSNDPVAGGSRMPDEAGWSLVGSFSNSAPSYVWVKVSDGTETTVTVSHGVANRETTLVVVSIAANPASIEGLSDQSRPTAETMAVLSGPVNTRFDFTLGDDAPAPYPTPTSEAILIAGHNGAAFRKSNSFYAIPLGPQGTGATIPGLTYDHMSNVGNGAWSMLLNVMSPGWFVGFVGSRA